LEDYTAALEVVSKNAKPVVLANRANVYSATRDYDKAIADFSAAIQLQPQTATYFAWRGACYTHKPDYAAAIADYSEALRLEPKNSAFLVSRGDCFRSQQKWDQAQSDYQASLELRKAASGAEHQLEAESLQKLGDLSRDKADYAAARDRFQQ